MTRLYVLLVLLGVAAPCVAYTIDLPALPDPGLEGDALYARIDSLEARYDEAEGSERADLAARLGLLSLSTGLSSQVGPAQDYFDEAEELDPSRPEFVYWSAIGLQRSGYYTMARLRMSGLLAREPDRVDHLVLLATLEFVESRLRYHKHDIEASYQLFLRALALEPDRTDALVGTGSTALLVGNHQLARSCAAKLRDEWPERIEGWYLHAAADFRLGNVEEAWVDYLKAISHAGPEERRIFLGGSILVRDEELAAIAKKTISSERARAVPGAAGRDGTIDWVEAVTDPGIRAQVLERWWMKRDPSPSAFENESELEYWTRLVEADLIFGRPDDGIRGWEVLPGEVWIRLGRPLSRYHWLPENQADVQMQEAPPPGSPKLTFDAHSVIWDWNYMIDGIPVTMRFVDKSYGQPLWSVGPGSTVDVGALRTEMPFVESARHRPPHAIELHASVAHFIRGSQSLLETSIAAYCPDDGNLARPAVDSLIVKWELRSAEGEPIDEVERTLGADHRRAYLLASSGVTGGTELRDPFLAMVGARLDAGEYSIGVRVIDPRTGSFSSKAYSVVVPELDPSGPLTLSSVQLSHGLSEWEPGQMLPREFIKHGRVVIPAADATVAGNALGVFFELANAGRDGTGQTSFDVEYAIYEATGQVRMLSMLGSFDPAELEEVELSTVQYLHERTGVSPEGLVVKGTAIDISGLREGDYVLQIRIDDRISEQSVSTVVPFRRPQPSAMVAGGGS